MVKFNALPCPVHDESILPMTLRDVGFDSRGRALLQSIDLQFQAREVSIVLGANGAGKSLLLRVCHGLLAPTRGCIQYPVAAHRARSRQAMVFQRPVLLRRSVRANIEYVLRQRRLPSDEREQRVEESLQLAGLSNRCRQPARLLSGGEQQKLALARAWALRPQILFLDEPCASLDPAATRAVEAFIHEIARSGVKIVMTTHDIGQAHRLADEIVFLHAGRLAEITPAVDFFARPRSSPGQAFVDGRLFV